MEQRRPRLGDIVDDYCPRERRVTNHAIVAMIEDDVKQTRCTTCDADHEYKHARVPPQRRKKEASALEGPFMEDVHVRPAQEADSDDAVADASLESSDAADVVSASVDASPDAPPISAGAADEDVAERRDDDGPVHRRLIRATLPRPEGQLPERKEPDFTIRQPSRGGRFDHSGSGGGQGNRPRHQRGGHSQHASGGHRQGQGGGNRDGNRAGVPGNSRQNGRPGPGGGAGPRRSGGGRRRGR